MQQSYASAAGVVEKVALVSLMEDALQINSEALTRHEVTVPRQFEEVPLLMVDKQKVLQILINLILNAMYALDARFRMKSGSSSPSPSRTRNVS